MPIDSAARIEEPRRVIWRGAYYALLTAVGALSFALSGNLPVGGPIFAATTAAMVILLSARILAWFIRHRPAEPLAEVRARARRVALWALDRYLLFQGAILFFAWLPPIKRAIPDRGGYWADPHFLEWERAALGRDSWEIMHMLPDFVTPPIDFIYSSWVIVMIIVSLGLATFAGAQSVARYFLSWAMAWTVLGVLLAHAFPSAGPIFGPDLGFGSEQLHFALQGTTAMRIHDGLWLMQVQRIEGLGGGISAMPSMHCALTFIFAAAAYRTRLRWPTLAYAAIIWFGSIYLGWHYALDGLVSLVGVAIIWQAAKVLTRTNGPLSWKPASNLIEVPARL